MVNVVFRAEKKWSEMTSDEMFEALIKKQLFDPAANGEGNKVELSQIDLEYTSWWKILAYKAKCKNEGVEPKEIFKAA